MRLQFFVAVSLACSLTSFAALTPLKSTDPGQTFTVTSSSNTALNGKSVNLYFDNKTSNTGEYDVVTKLGATLIYQLRNGELYSQTTAGKTGKYKDTGLVGGLEFFEPPLELFQFRNASSIATGSSFQKSIKKWYLQQVGATASTYELLATTTAKSHGFFACLTPDKPPTRIAASGASLKKSHYVIGYSSGGGTVPSNCKAVGIQTTLT